MTGKIENLVFEGGGVLGIAYLGALDYLFRNGLMGDITRVAGTSAGAITACVLSFNLPFWETRRIANSLDYRKVPSKGELEDISFIPEDVMEVMERFFDDIICVYRLMNNYGWFSTDYFYGWMRDVINAQFDVTKKSPPYTFEDFKNPLIHKDNRPFFDLYVIGTDISMKTSQIFSYETTPRMEVAQAVRISMSVPLFFEAVIKEHIDSRGNAYSRVFCDGGLMNNYPLSIFDYPRFNSDLYGGVNLSTLGLRFKNKLEHNEINNLWQYIDSLLRVSSYIQQQNYESNPLNQERSIIINTKDTHSLDFNIDVNDATYRFLYQQGYNAAKEFFSNDRQQLSSI
ncbi:patatin-like phospholipase family protein [Anaerotignum sp. MB30-C6]|uniref:patatin-like phospholipase family protein n=1 Tax=Anaerotignum sp. MB30-C6 TaxID=3070814 RepID=UPI0027DE092A|nr:patatin-like phospholipase family protein [Anaerotignum sp. MB30-C6]WMI80030.1 patatin-like phospholipase family protein [Anaerotignum sp. MB30-C6]